MLTAAERDRQCVRFHAVSARMIPRRIGAGQRFGPTILGLVLLMAAAMGCAESGSSTVPDLGQRRGSPGPGQIERAVELRARERALWPGEVALARIEETLAQWFGSLRSRALPDALARALLTPAAQGEAPTSPRHGADGALQTRVFDVKTVTGREAIAAAWTGYMQGFDDVTRTEHHVSALALEAGQAQQGAELSVVFRITGQRGGDLRQDQGRLALKLAAETRAAWRITGLRLTSLRGVSGQPAFVARQLPVRRVDGQPQGAALFVAYFAEGASIVDLNRDEAPDLILGNRDGPASVLLNDGRGGFTEAGARLGLGDIAGLRSAYGLDWDNDGDADLLLVTQFGLRLLEHRAEGFADVSARSGFDHIRVDGLTSAAIADYDGDGLLDFYVCGYGDPARSPIFDYFDSRSGYFNKLFRNQGGGRFEDTTAAAGLAEDNRRWSFAALWLDLDEDRRPDLYVVNDYGPNQLYRNRADGGFEDVGAASGAGDLGNGMSVSSGDLDGDGRIDLFVSNMHSWAGRRILHQSDLPEARRRTVKHFLRGNSLLLAKGDSRFERVSGPFDDAKWAWGNRLFDYDNDGDLDLYVVNGMLTNLRTADLDPHFWRNILIPVAQQDPSYALGSAVLADRLQTYAHSFAGHERNRFFHNLGGGRFADAAAVSGLDLVQDGRAVVSGDLDADGDLDLVVANRNAPRAVLLENVADPPGHWLAVDLEGRASNRQGVGTWLRLRCADGRTQVRYSQIGSGYVSQSHGSQWFGLGDCEQVERLVLDWPSGARQVLSDLGADRRIRVVEGVEGAQAVSMGGDDDAAPLP